MSKCTKVKNPCKICLGPVSQKTGLQCQGACQSWVHYSCLNYTPGRINDIKKGIINVTCPCPDCNTTQPKEYRTDKPYSCDNSYCPANRPPQCENSMCPTNKGGDKINQTLGYKPCPLNKCGTDCKQHSSPQLPNNPPAQFAQPCMPPDRMPGSSSSDACLDLQGCPSGCTHTSSEAPGDSEANYDTDNMPMEVVQEMCNTVGQLTNQINQLMTKMKQFVTDKGGGGSSGGGGCCPKANKSCAQKGPKSLCPKPCYCAGNPTRRK